MGLWGDDNNQTAAIYLNLKANGIKWVTEAPVFENYKTQESNWQFNWDLVGITIRPESAKNQYETIQMEFIDDKQDRYVVSTTFTNIAMCAINSFVWGMEAESNFEKLTLSLYKKGEYARIGIFANGDMMNWAYEMEFLLWMTKKVTVNGKEVTDKTELNEFLRGKIGELDEYLKWLTREVKDKPFNIEDNEVTVDHTEDMEQKKKDTEAIEDESPTKASDWNDPSEEEKKQHKEAAKETEDNWLPF